MLSNLIRRLAKFRNLKKIRTKITYIIIKFIIGFVQYIRALFYRLISTLSFKDVKAFINQPLYLTGNGEVIIGKCHLGVYPSPYFFSTYIHIEARHISASVTMEDGTWLNNNAVIVADKTQIHIGKEVLIGPNVFITDSDFHSLNPNERLSQNYECFPVYISDNVFIGANVTILKGVTIGLNSVIANGSVVNKNVPSNVVVGGVPAKVIREL